MMNSSLIKNSDQGLLMNGSNDIKDMPAKTQSLHKGKATEEFENAGKDWLGYFPFCRAVLKIRYSVLRAK